MPRRPGRPDRAREAYARAIELSGNDSECRFLERRVATLPEAG